MSDNHKDAQGEQAAFEKATVFGASDYAKGESGQYIEQRTRHYFNGWMAARRASQVSAAAPDENKLFGMVCNYFNIRSRTGQAVEPWRILWEYVQELTSIRASSGQAQTSAAVWDYATMGLPNEEVIEMWRASGISGTVPFSFANRIQESLQAKIAAQLADSAAQGAPDEETVIGAGNPESFFAEFCEVQGYPSDGELDAALRSTFYEGIRYCAMQPKSAAPTAQQSLTAGAVPEHPSTASMPPDISDALKAACDLAPWLAAALDDDAVCAEYKAAIRAWFNSAMPRPNFGLSIAAAPLPQVQPSEALDANIWQALLKEVMSEIPDYRGRPGNAPFHGHSIPGVWDSDNGAKAGKECAWCKVWNAARKAMADQQPVTPSGALEDSDGGVA